MEYLAAYRYAFGGERWFVNLLLVTVCFLIPVVGPMVVMGHMAEVLEARSKDRAAPRPEFYFERFGDYLTRGVWIFLVVSVLVYAHWHLSAQLYALYLARGGTPVQST